MLCLDRTCAAIRGAISSHRKGWRFALRSRPPSTGLPRGPGRKVPQRVLLEWFWAPGSEHFRALPAARCPKKHSKSTLWGTFRPGPLGTLVDGGRDHKICLLFVRSLLRPQNPLEAVPSGFRNRPFWANVGPYLVRKITALLAMLPLSLYRRPKPATEFQRANLPVTWNIMSEP